MSDERWQYVQVASPVMLFRRPSQSFLYLEVLSYLWYLIGNKGEHYFSEVISDFCYHLVYFCLVIAMSPVFHREHTDRGNNSEWKKERGGVCEKEGG